MNEPQLAPAAPAAPAIEEITTLNGRAFAGLSERESHVFAYYSREGRKHGLHVTVSHAPDPENPELVMLLDDDYALAPPVARVSVMNNHDLCLKHRVHIYRVGEIYSEDGAGDTILAADLDLFMITSDMSAYSAELIKSIPLASTEAEAAALAVQYLKLT